MTPFIQLNPLLIPLTLVCCALMLGALHLTIEVYKLYREVKWYITLMRSINTVPDEVEE